MIILDTNILSALMRRTPDRQVIAWLDEQPRTSIWTTSVTILEIRFGLQIMVAGKRRSLLMQAFETALDKMAHRIASFDDLAATHAAELMAARQRKGRPGDLRDTMIARRFPKRDSSQLKGQHKRKTQLRSRLFQQSHFPIPMTEALRRQGAARFATAI